MNSSRRCDISFVVTSRNDDFGGTMLARLRLCAQNLMELANRHNLHGELIIVEWNPPDGPRLSDVLKLETTSDIFSIRFIEAPAQEHQKLRNSDIMPLFQMIAKNVGVRRARGAFICATNQDILFSDELMKFLASGQLDGGTLYRIDRTDVKAEVPADLPVAGQLEWARRNILRVHGKYGTYRHAWWTAAGFWAQLTGTNWLGAAKEKQRTSRPMNVSTKSGVFVIRSLMRFAFAAMTRLIDPQRRIHTNACGDFTLLSKDIWFQVRGYPEIPVYSLHIDSLFCFMAAACGLRERVLAYPAQVFHLEHGSSWAVMNPEERLRWFAAKPWVDYTLIEQIWNDMLKEKRPIVFNPDDWGLGGSELREIRVLGGKREVIG